MLPKPIRGANHSSSPLPLLTCLFIGSTLGLSRTELDCNETAASEIKTPMRTRLERARPQQSAPPNFNELCWVELGRADECKFFATPKFGTLWHRPANARAGRDLIPNCCAGRPAGQSALCARQRAAFELGRRRVAAPRRASEIKTNEESEQSKARRRPPNCARLREAGEELWAAAFAGRSHATCALGRPDAPSPLGLAPRPDEPLAGRWPIPFASCNAPRSGHYRNDTRRSFKSNAPQSVA